MFNISLLPSGVAFKGKTEETLLSAALQQGINLEYSCKKGSCGVCIARVTEGAVDSKDPFAILTDEDRKNQKVLVCCTTPKSDIQLEADYLPELDGIQPKSLPCKVSTIAIEDDVAMLRLRLPPSAQFKYLPGQFIDLTYKGVRRSYSIANASAATEGIELHIRKVEKGQFSEFVFNEIGIDHRLSLEGPLGSFFVREGTQPIVFLATGTGFAPVKAMVESLRSTQPDRQIHIYWGVRKANEFYSSEPATWERQSKNVTFVPVVSRPDVNWHGRNGYIIQALLDDFETLENVSVYACGSPDMIKSAQNELPPRGLNKKQFFFDAFLPSN